MTGFAGRPGAWASTSLSGIRAPPPSNVVPWTISTPGTVAAAANPLSPDFLLKERLQNGRPASPSPISSLHPPSSASSSRSRGYHAGRHVEVNGVRKVQQPVDPLSARARSLLPAAKTHRGGRADVPEERRADRADRLCLGGAWLGRPGFRAEWTNTPSHRLPRERSARTPRTVVESGATRSAELPGGATTESEDAGALHPQELESIDRSVKAEPPLSA
jgi:hypothetical protein